MHYVLGFCVRLLLYTAGQFKQIRNSAQMLSFSGCRLKLSTSRNFSFFMVESFTLLEGREGTAWESSEQYIFCFLHMQWI
jgi:hypothetical protein